MIYFLTSKINAYDMIEFDHASSIDYTLFMDARFIPEHQDSLNYEIKNKSILNRIKKYSCIECVGPTLVSAALRDILKDAEDNSEVQFLDVNITCEGESVSGFFAIHPLNRIACTDMDASEYDVANFDPWNPSYSFYYQVLRKELVDEFGRHLSIAICNEKPSRIVVTDGVVKKIRAAKIKGFRLYSALDRTPQDRSVCIET